MLGQCLIFVVLLLSIVLLGTIEIRPDKVEKNLKDSKQEEG